MKNGYTHLLQAFSPCTGTLTNLPSSSHSDIADQHISTFLGTLSTQTQWDSTDAMSTHRFRREEKTSKQ